MNRKNNYCSCYSWKEEGNVLRYMIVFEVCLLIMNFSQEVFATLMGHLSCEDTNMVIGR